MCDARAYAGKGWKGWLELPSRGSADVPAGAWVDLSHPLDEDMPRVAFFPVPRFERILSFPEHPLNVTEMQMCVHTGTHVDAPRHFFEDGPAFHEIPVERLSGSGVVWRIEKEPGSVIEPTDFVAAHPKVRAGDIVALDTGWSGRVGTDSYEDHPCLSVQAAQWLVEHKVKLLAVDFPTPDLAVRRRAKGFDWPVHHVLLSHGVLVSEHLTHLRTLAGQRVEFAFLALNIQGSDGSPARVMARPVQPAA